MTPTESTEPAGRSEEEALASYPPLTPEQQQRFTAAADAALRVRRATYLLAEHATGHRKQVHGHRCEECNEDFPCSTVRRAAGPVLDAVADLPSQQTAGYRSPAQVREAQAAALREAADALASEEAERSLTEFMTRHVQSHQNSNNPNSWGCDGRCASQAALMHVSREVRARADSLSRTGVRSDG